MIRALLVGGPLHGTLFQLDTDDAVFITPELEGDEFIYVRRNGGDDLSPNLALFVHGRPAYEDLVDAIKKSELSDTTKNRTLADTLRLRVIKLGD
jgi:hypothetical protein